MSSYDHCRSFLFPTQTGPSNVCSDVIQACVTALLNLRNPGGSTPLETYNEIGLLVCPTAASVTQDSVAAALESGYVQGVFMRTYRDGVEQAYLVNGDMTFINPRNQQYLRPLYMMFSCEQNGARQPQDAAGCRVCHS